MSNAHEASPGTAHERQPLLPTSSTSKIPSITEVEAVEASQSRDEPLDDELLTKEPTQPKTRSYWGLAWNAFWAVVIVFGLAIFIKGFIDADDTDFDLGKALKSALGGGLSGAAAMVLQVLLLMPLRTVMNYQYRYGTSTTTAIRTLYHDGGFPRYYAGLVAALVQGPIARFGDTAANAGILALLHSNSYMKMMPEWFKTIFASVAAAAFRMILTPIDTIKTTMQTQGRDAMKILRIRVKEHGVRSLWYGALATAAATFVGHFPWFATYNELEQRLPEAHTIIQTLFRQAFIGFCASVVSDTVSNSLRVVKTYRQVHEGDVSYTAAASAVIAVDGIRGLFGRGLKTRIIANGMQGLMFSILWKLFMDIWNGKTKA